ncbi:hypothetical protein ACILD6_02505 [Capnocytophaga canimorsus]|uniref:Uncharacterized protein n=1 Tax=Capnocytophaga canimorsus TaxID=28188 RepID=A0A0B7IG52_9FLAO|nr:hypothetical protein [Capnocytophaga canimorsus]CEN50800.1 conserved hypothetical protein [Capnocytophaga canimorsus]
MSLLIRNRKPIRLRPEIVLTNEEFGHFEVDLIVGAEHKGADSDACRKKNKISNNEEIKW